MSAMKAVFEALVEKCSEHKMEHQLDFKNEGEMVRVWCRDCEGEVSEMFRKVEVVDVNPNYSQ